MTTKTKQPPLTPREKKKLLRQRVEAFKENLPTNWIQLFIHDHKEFKGCEQFLSNVKLGRSLDESTISKIENWISTL